MSLEVASTSVDSALFRNAGSLEKVTPRMPWRFIPPFERDEAIVGRAQTPFGRAVILACALVLMRAIGANLSPAVLACACAYAGRYRWSAIALATLVISFENGFWIDADLIAYIARQEGVSSVVNVSVLGYAATAAVVSVCWALLRIWPKAPPPVSMLRSTVLTTSVFVGLLILAQSRVLTGESRVAVWAFLLAFLPYFWFLGYALSQSGAKPRAPIWQQLSLFHPFWGSSLTPFGKMQSYLQKFEAKSAPELAVTQIKGLKLLIWTVAAREAQALFGRVFYTMLHIPMFEDAFRHFCDGRPDSWAVSWASLILSFFFDLMTLTIWGAEIVAVARLAGFRLRRNTYNPLAARTIADFWNRYYFFYKELLVDFFFYPTFYGAAGTNRKLRLFLATFMSACVGNLLFHFLRDIRFIAHLGFRQALEGEASHAFYTFCLAIGIFLSQVYERPATINRGWVLDRAVPTLRVLVFFWILHVFDAPEDREHSFAQHLNFLTYLLGAGI